MRCFETKRGNAWRHVARCLLYLACIGGFVPAWGHKASDSYLQIEQDANGLSVRWDIALRDLDAALDLDLDGDGRLTWAEVKTGWPRIEAYGLAHLQIEGCALRAVDRALERRNDGAYAVMQLRSNCRPAGPPVIAYTLFHEVDPTHRGIAKVQQPGRALSLSVLDPNHPPAVSGVAIAGVEKAAGASGDASSASAGLTDSATRTGNAAVGTTVAPASNDGWTSGLGFAREGVRHILTGYDHVLFLLCLLLPSVMRRTAEGWRPVQRLRDAVWPVVGIVSAFTVAHSITLGLAATKVVSLAPAFIEPAIAVTIILAALDNIWPVFPVRRVVVTFFFGLIHGFGFAGVLAELNLPTARFAWALLQFNLGLEVGQLLIVGFVTTALFLARNWLRYPRWVIRYGSVAAITVGAVWLIERTANVSLLGF